MTETRCPRCNGVFTPDQIRAAAPTATCTFCKTAVVIAPRKQVDDASPNARPTDWPPSFEFAEREATTFAPPHASPYREAALAKRENNFSVAWLEREHNTRPTTLAIYGASIGTGVLLGIAGAGFAALLMTMGMIVGLSLAAAGGERTVPARSLAIDADGVRFQRRSWTGRWVRARLAADDIEQVFVIDKQATTIETLVERYAVCALAGGREAELIAVETPEQAWWLEERLEHHLEIVDRPVRGELKKP